MGMGKEEAGGRRGGRGRGRQLGEEVTTKISRQQVDRRLNLSFLGLFEGRLSD